MIFKPNTGKQMLLSIAAAALFAASGAASALTISNVSDSDGSSAYFDITLNTATTVGDITTIDLGIDAVNGFKAEAPAAGPPALPFDSAFDTVQLTITADPGTQLVSLDFIESLMVTTGATGYAQINGSVAVAGGGTKGFNALYLPNTGATFDTASISPDFVFAPGTTEIVVTVSNSLFAINDASIEKTSASLVVETAPIPLPIPLALLGSGLLGFVLVGRRNRQA